MKNNKLMMLASRDEYKVTDDFSISVSVADWLNGNSKPAQKLSSRALSPRPIPR